MLQKQTDVVIIGSGPGGATVARELARSDAGLGITLLEKGRDWRRSPLYGTYPGGMMYTDKASFLTTQERLTIVRELGIAPLPLSLRGVASTRIADAAADLGLDWFPQDKFMQPARSHNGFACGATCMLGCRCGAKRNAAQFVDEAVREGIDLWTGASVDRILHENGRVTGVWGKKNGKPFARLCGCSYFGGGRDWQPAHFAA